jgi:primosomal protein N' (replication factor Y)
MGCVIDPHAIAPEGGTLRDVLDVLDTEPYLPDHIVDLALWVAEYYAAGPGDALTVALPPLAGRGGSTAFRTVKVAEPVPPSENAPAAMPRGPKQLEALALIARVAEGIQLPVLQKQGVSLPTVRSLERLGLVRIREEVVERDPFQDVGGVQSAWALAGGTPGSRELTPEQALAFRHLEEAVVAGQFQAMLLQGVTGSGKTELYVRLAALVLSRGRRALVLVPEIALTPAVAGLFRARFGRRVTIQHSGLSHGERHDQWHRIRRGEVDIVVGPTMSAINRAARAGISHRGRQSSGSSGSPVGGAPGGGPARPPPAAAGAATVGCTVVGSIPGGGGPPTLPGSHSPSPRPPSPSRSRPRC